jgi:two-component system, OmpR family, sensor kinase
MKLQTRLTITVTLIIAFIAAAVGGFAILRSESVELNRIDRVLVDYSTQLSTTNDDPLMLSQFLVEESPFPVTMTYLTPDGDVVQLSESAHGLQEAPTKQELTESTANPISLDAPNPVRMSAAPLGDGDYLLVSTSLEPVITNRADQIKLLSLFTLGMMLLGFLVTFVFFRQDSQLANLVMALQQRQKHMQEFLGDASHELRTPLTVIKGYVELLSSNNVSDTALLERYYSRMGTEIDRMETLIRDLLLIAELSEDSSRTLEEFDLSSALQHQITDLVQLEPARSVTQSLEGGISIMCSPDLMVRLLSNVFSNIRRHTPNDAPVNISLKKVRTDVLLTIEDGGPGLPKDAYSAGIQFFQRFDQSRSRESGGSGLGMSIMRGIADSIDGTINLQPSTLGGLAVQMRFPINPSK